MQELTARSPDHEPERADTGAQKGFAQRFAEANRLLEQGLPAEAEVLYRALLLEDPQSAPLLTKLGHALAEQGRLDEALTVLGWAEATDPHFPWAHVGLADALARLSDTEGAIRHLEQAQKLDPGLAFLAERRQALGSSKPPPARPPETPPSFRERFEAANRLYETRRFADAEVVYASLLESEPESAPLLTMLGNIALQFGREADAANWFDRAEAVDTAYPWLHVGRSELLAAQERYEEAVAALERARASAPALEMIERRIASIRHVAHLEARRGVPPEILHWPAEPDRPRISGSDRPRLAVIAWDLTHNPVGRAWTLAELASDWADCEVLGPLFPAYGSDLWEPLRLTRRAVPVKGFAADTFAQFIAGAIRLAADTECDAVWVSKPRLPSLLLAFLLKHMRGVPVVCDIDDDELAFVGEESALDLSAFLAGAGHADWREPFSARWTQLAQSMIGWADAVTVCNPVLQRKHGGFVIRHARDEQAYDPARVDRPAIRARLGFTAEDKVVLFLGTPRRHKGILELLRALEEIGDERAVLCIVGSIPDRSLREEIERRRSVRVVSHPDTPFAQVAELNAMADVVCILQDADNAVARCQTPAKLTDALAMGAPVLAFPGPPIDDLVGQGGIVTTDREALPRALRRMLDGGATDAGTAEARRRFFLAELSKSANAPRARSVFQLARRKSKALPDSFGALMLHIDRNMPGTVPAPLARELGGVLPVAPRVGRLQTIDQDLNIVFFWKQNDTGLYGRRQEMLLDRLSRLPRVRRILHIDAPVSVDALVRRSSGGDDRDEDRFVAAQVLARFHATEDDGLVFRRTFVHRGQETALLGRELPHREFFPNAVEGWLRGLGMLDNLIAWVCPVVPMFADVHARLEFPLVVADVIDDQRQWPMPAAQRAKLAREYRQTFAVTDVAVANCMPVARWLREEGLAPIVVPNGMELHDDPGSWPVPAELRRLPRPIVGYVGNLHDRIDWRLVARIADARPDRSIVLIGSAPRNEVVADILSRPNVRMTGVVPYREALRYVAALDAAIIPHARTSLSDRMNPLKLYVYRSLGVPVVSTAVANLDDLASDIRVAETHDQFLSLLDDAIEERARYGRIFPDPVRMRAMCWESRLDSIMAEVDRAFAAKLGEGQGAEG